MYLQESERSIYSGGDYQSVILLQSFILIFLFLFAQFSQQIVGRSKEKRSCYSCAEVKQTIGIPYRIADEHTFQHLPGRTERTCITDEVLPYSPLDVLANGMLARTIFRSSPILVTALCAF